MKRPFPWLALLCHAVIVLSAAAGTLAVLDIYNPLMGFLSGPYSKTVLLAAFVLAIVLGIASARRDRRECASGSREDARAKEEEEV